MELTNSPPAIPGSQGPRLTAKPLPLNTVRENVVVLARACALLQSDRLHPTNAYS